MYPLYYVLVEFLLCDGRLLLLVIRSNQWPGVALLRDLLRWQAVAAVPRLAAPVKVLVGRHGSQFLLAQLRLVQVCRHSLGAVALVGQLIRLPPLGPAFMLAQARQ